MVDDQPIVLPDPGQELHEYTPWGQPAAPAPRPQAPEPRAGAPMPETHPISGLQDLGACDTANTTPGGAQSARC
jgi:hypothetical protein